jgi:DNA repair protein RadC
MSTQLALITEATKTKTTKRRSCEYRPYVMRECQSPTNEKALCDTPECAVNYWRLHVQTSDTFNPDVESFVVLYLNTRRRVIGHAVVSTGILDTILVHPREVFRLAVVLPCAAMVLMHNHPSDDPSPSEADIKVTRDLMRAGQLMKIEVLDHVIIGQPTVERPKAFSSLRELGYLYA